MTGPPMRETVAVNRPGSDATRRRSEEWGTHG
jgi:hypothetical protein